MEYNNYINQEQSESFDYCSKLNKKFAIFGQIVLSIFCISFAVVMAYSIYLLITNPVEISDSTAKNTFYLITSVVMLVGTLIIIWDLILKPLFKNPFNKKIFMSEEGVFSQVNNSRIHWDEIKEISVGLKGAKNSVISYIFIQGENYKYNKWFTKSIFYHEDLITMECTQELLDTIKQFYGDEIKNLEGYRPKAEKKYMKDAMIFLSIVLFPIAVFIILVVHFQLFR